MTAITGSLVALLTPMLEDGRVDYPGLRKLIDWHIAEGTNCIVVVGTTGESPTVTVEEHREIIRVSVEHAAGRGIGLQAVGHRQLPHPLDQLEGFQAFLLADHVTEQPAE